jgi:hypothetical protein
MGANEATHGHTHSLTAAARIQGVLTARGDARRAIDIDADRAIVECFFGRLKRRFRFLGDETFRLNQRKLEMAVTLCIAPTNHRQRRTGYALSTPPVQFVRSSLTR